MKEPIVFAGLITKNEERDLPRCLRSIDLAVDGVVIVDTGSIDRTLEIAKSTILKPIYTRVYTGASKRDENGDWKLCDVSKARNVFVREIERLKADWVLWMDADDELLNPIDLRGAVQWKEFTVFGVQIESCGQRWVQHRLWRTGLGIRFHGRCHEYPHFAGQPSKELQNVVIRHDAKPGFGESSNQRNLRILQEEYKANPTPRTAFYLANTHKDASRFREAIVSYEHRISFGEHYRDEWLTSYLYKARCERAAGLIDSAKSTLLEALSKDSRWAEFWMELAYIAYGETRFVNCIGYCLQALDAPIPPTQLWRERNKYTDQPARMISWCYEHLGYLETALHWAVTAREKIGAPDASWEERIARLEKPRIALSRPGAIGDILMTLNLIPHFRAKYPGHSIHYFCDAGIGAMLKGIMKAAGVDIAENSVDFNFRQNEFSKCFNLIGYPFHEGYPEKPMRQHLINYFAEELGLGEIDPLVIPVPTRLAGLPERYATLQPRALWSAYKNWPFDRWERVLEACSDIPVYQIGARGEPPIPGARHDFLGTTMSNAISLVANARLHLGVDSFANHLTFFRWGGRQVPAVILWGSTQPTAAGYAHNSNLSLALWCQPCFREDPKRTRVPRGPCVNPAGQHYENPCHACMAGLHVDLVVEELRRLWAKVTNTTVVSGAKSREAC